MASFGEHRDISNHGFSFSKNVMCLCASFNCQGHHIASQFPTTLGHHLSPVSFFGLAYHVVLKASAKLRRMANCLLRPACYLGSLHVLHPSSRGTRKQGLLRFVHMDSIRLEKLDRPAARFILKVISSSQISQDHDILLAPARLQLISIRRKSRQATTLLQVLQSWVFTQSTPSLL